ncbi:MAG: class I SAM-dependent methyltransferase [Candidatus Acidiferrales bacterium]
MPRLRLFEIHDQPWFPEFLRREVVDGLQMVLEATNAYHPIARRLRDAITRTGTSKVLDLFSGAGGPWPSLVREFAADGAKPVEVFLTDRYPSAVNRNGDASGQAERIHFIAESIDANEIPERLAGFRTVFSSFHHFNSADARRFLEDSASRRRGVGVFEVASRHTLTILSILFIPLLNWLVTPFRRPFRWSRLLWTYLIPIVPFVLLFDGLASCLRSYSLADLHKLTNGVAPADYQWEIGEENGGLIPIRVTYLIGFPQSRRTE